MNKYEKIMDLLREECPEEIMWFHNTYCERNHYDNYIYSMRDVEEMLEGCSLRRVLRKVAHKDFNIRDRFFQITATSLRFVSFDDINDGDQVYFDDIVQYIIDNDDDLGDVCIRDILEEEEQ